MTEQNKAETIGVAAIACRVPDKVMSIRDVFASEGAPYGESIAERLGVDQVRVYDGPSKTAPAIDAARECLAQSGFNADDIDIILDFSVLPEDYVVPAWCISNPIQQEIGARNAVNMGLAGNNTTGLIFALRSAYSLVKSGQARAVLLASSDVAISGNRVLGNDSPLSVIGDGASALIVAAGSGVCEIVDSALESDAERHDVLCIQGGCIAHPARDDLYRINVNWEKLDLFQAWHNTRRMADNVLQKNNLSYQDIHHLFFPGISAADKAMGLELLGQKSCGKLDSNRRTSGHMQATDICINLEQVSKRERSGDREWGLILSHGWGFAYGAMLVRI